MLLKNTKARLITIRDTATKFYRVLPGNNPAVEVPNRLCEMAFAKALIESGELRVDSKEDVIEGATKKSK